MNRATHGLILAFLSTLGCGEAGDPVGPPVGPAMPTGGCSDQTPRVWDNPSEGTATIVTITERDGQRLLTLDYTAVSWSTAERQEPVSESDIAGLPDDLALVVGQRVNLRAVFHLSQVCANTPTDAAPPSWTYVSGPEPG